jgi:hypothetical protein
LHLCCILLLLFFHVSTTNIVLHTNSISTNELLSGLESNSFIDLKTKRRTSKWRNPLWVLLEERYNCFPISSTKTKNIIIRPLHNELIMVILVRK